MSATEVRIRLALPPRSVMAMGPDDAWPPAPRVTEPSRPMDRPPSAIDADNAARQLGAEREFVAAALRGLADGLQDVRAAQEKQTAGLQQLAVELAIVISGKLLCKQIDEERFEIEAMVRDMAAQLVDDEPVAVRLNPKDLHLMQRRLGQRLLFPDSAWAPKIVPDAAVERGACIVEGNRGSLATDPAAQLMKVRDDLLERMSHARS